LSKVSGVPEVPYYKEHWVEIDKTRLDRYQRMFEWDPTAAVLYELADIHEGHSVADFGCGPGHTAIEISRWVGPLGSVHALDINAAFVSQARENAQRAEVADRVTVHQSDGSQLPLDDGSLDRLTTRNTLIYVDDPLSTLGEFMRVLRPGGKVHAIEGDWPMMVVEPVPPESWHALVSAASHACRTPDIGRKLTGHLARSGFRDINLQVITRPDMDGRMLPMIKNMARYARDSGNMANMEIDAILTALDQALENGTYLALAPQFIVTGIR
jgi:ubiquinone/menaquinone biosynthesis C-methylase UbiE